MCEDRVKKELQIKEDTPIGTWVKVHRDNGEVMLTKTRSEPFYTDPTSRYHKSDLCVFIEGIAGYYQGWCIEVVEYPEHEKLHLVADKSQKIGEFVDWLKEKNYAVCELGESEQYYPVYKPITDLLAEFFGIDKRALEKEKLDMLEKIRKANSESKSEV